MPGKISKVDQKVIDDLFRSDCEWNKMILDLPKKTAGDPRFDDPDAWFLTEADKDKWIKENAG